MTPAGWHSIIESANLSFNPYKMFFLQRGKGDHDNNGMTPFENFFADMWDPFSMFGNHPMLKQSSSLRVDVYETDKDLVIEADVPGYSPKDIEVELNNRTLIVRGKQSQETDKKENQYFRKERMYSSFERRFNLPAEVDLDGIKSDLKNGKLSIKVPKSGSSNVKKIPIES